MKKTLFLFLILLSFSFIHCEFKEKSEPALADHFEWHPDRVPLISPHRGGPYAGFPENCIETFENVIQYTDAIIECDIAMTKDNVLIMMHDNTLDRTTTGSGNVSDQNWGEIQQLYLKDFNGNVTDFRIPTLEDVLLWGKDKCLFTLDIKKGVPFEEVINLVESTQTENDVIIITYNVDQAKKVYRLNSKLMISAGIYQPDDLSRHLDAGINPRNLIAFTGTALRESSLYDLLHENGIYCILGTLGNLDKRAEVRGDQIYMDFIHAGVDILATDRPIEAAKAIQP